MFAEKLLASVVKADVIANSSDAEEMLEMKFVPVGMMNGSMSIQKPQTVITDLGKALLQAAKSGNTEKVHELMSRGAPFTADWLGTSPLHLAARYNHVDTCKVLLRAGISKDSKTKVDRTPLHFAVYQGNIEIVELLLNSKCEVDAKDMLKMSALHWAVEKRHNEIVEMLLQHGADPNAMSKFGKSPISIATEAGQVDLVRILLLANQMRAASREQVQEATENLMYELKQHKERSVAQLDDTEDNITMDLSNDESMSNMSSSHKSGVEHHDTNTNDTDNLIEKEDSLSDAIINLEQNTEQDPKNLDSNTLQMLKEHGIAMIPSDDSGSSLITSAIQSGRKIVLSEAGKFALNETRVQSAATTTPVPTTKKTIKIIKKTTPYGMSGQQQYHGHHRQPLGHGHAGGGGTIKTNKVIKILSAEEFKQICGGEVGGLKKLPSSDYRKAVQSSATMRVPQTVQRQAGNFSSYGSKTIKKIVMTKNRLSSGGSGSYSNENAISKLSSVNSIGSGSNSNSINSNNNNRHIITSADGVKRLRTATGMEIISKLPTKIPQDTVVSVEGAAVTSGVMGSRQASGIIPISTISAGQPRQSQVVSNNSNFSSSNSALSGGFGSGGSGGSGSSMTLGELERHFLELKKQTDDLRKQFELSQNQNEEYRARVEKLEKEVQTLKQSSSNNPNNFIEIV
ncbi:uncharacterized protein LOC131689046 [Topomyia yanbarensis]|uniref:uncharacterized protein LOC131689046 n=1 Tax=Topomyia yanbarensis TaxID=2498891 RepID=UPI00273AF8FC|nr:uncharacterized protein LOC131689046 [Topomyia yanbarensis]XP_058829778.1 uncharacterized protein LOC131689046 [Topomyia yanbarensis]